MNVIERMPIAAGAAIATLLQVFLAPHIGVFHAVPNFMAAYCLALAVVRAESFGPGLPFVLGLLYDLISGGPVGAMAFTLTALSAGCAQVFLRANNDTRFMAIAVLAASVLLVEVVYGLFYLALGYSASLFEALVYHVMPCFVYDTVIAVAVYFAVGRLFRREAPLQSEIRQLQ